MIGVGLLVAVLVAAAIYHAAKAAGYTEGYNAGHDSGMEDGFSDAWNMYAAFRLDNKTEAEKRQYKAAAEAAGREEQQC